MTQFFISDRASYSLEFRRIAKRLMSYSAGHSATTIRVTCAQTSTLELLDLLNAHNAQSLSELSEHFCRQVPPRAAFNDLSACNARYTIDSSLEQYL